MNSFRVMIPGKTECVVTVKPTMICMTSCVCFMKNRLHSNSFFILLQTELLLLSFSCDAPFIFRSLFKISRSVRNDLRPVVKSKFFASLRENIPVKRQLLLLQYSQTAKETQK